MNNKATVLVNSCDTYEDCWYPFFKLLKKYWPDRKFPIVLNTESKIFEYEDMNIKTLNVLDKYKNKNISWSRRLKDVLKRIDSKYIIFMMDDFFIMDYVDTKKLDKVINWMEQDNNIAVFSFFRVEDEKHKDKKSLKYPDFYLRNQRGDYKYNCQAAVWNRKELIRALRNYESAWEWELFGNVRSYRSKKLFYTLNDPKKYIFKYNCELYGVVRGKWRLPETQELFAKEDIKIDFSVRNNRKEKILKKENKLINKIKYYYIKIRSLV